MKSRDILLDFIHHAFVLFLIGFFLIFIVAGDRFDTIIKLMESLAPIAVFALIFIIMVEIRRARLKAARERNNEEEEAVTLYLYATDRFKGDVVIFLIPVIVLLLAFFADGIVNKVDVLQATVAFFMAYFWQKYLFKHGREQ